MRNASRPAPVNLHRKPGGKRFWPHRLPQTALEHPETAEIRASKSKWNKLKSAENRYKRAEKVFPTSLGPGDRAFEPHYSDQNLRFWPHKRRKAECFAAFSSSYGRFGGNNMFTKAFNAIFMTRPFWNEVNVPQRLVLKIYKEYLETKNMIITSRAESIKYISPIVNRLHRLTRAHSPLSCAMDK